MNISRVRSLTESREVGEGPIVYWMSRDQRAHDNWALIFAQSLAIKYEQPLVVIFALAGEYLGGTRRQYDFMLRGLEEVEATLRELAIGFIVREGKPSESVLSFTESIKAGAIVTDFDPLREKRKWRDQLLLKTKLPVFEVDAHNIVPVWKASEKLEYGAYTLRPKIHKLLPEYLEKFPRVKVHPYPGLKKMGKVDWKHLHRWRKVDENVTAVDWCSPGEKAANRALNMFVSDRLLGYNEHRNDPTLAGQSDLSPYLRFGQLSAQRVALLVHAANAPLADREAFLEELIIRRELSDNYCYYNPHYDRPQGFPDWAKRTLDVHRTDPREYIYTLQQFDQAKTHDPLWNAAQNEMRIRGKMHGYMRMYWAKKILEWTKSVDDAMQVAIALNDKYELDGRDPNGYAGIAWSLGGVHDRAWFDRPIFGQIRYMNANGCKAKFDVEGYIARWKGA